MFVATGGASCTGALHLKRFIKLAPDYIMIQIGNRDRGIVPRQGNLNGFLSRGIIRWKPHGHNLFLNSRILPVLPEQVLPLAQLSWDWPEMA